MSDIITNARKWLNTPWMHNQKTKHIGVDCIGFLFAVAEESGYVFPPLPPNYTRIALKDGIREYLDSNLISSTTIQTESVLLFQFAGYNNHVAIAASSNSIIHASYSHRKVVEHPLDGIWLRTLKGIWTIPPKQ
jgi:cell wall-associated NlpC family hydrolase